MSNRAQDDDLVITLVEAALARPASDRESYLQSACGDDLDLYRRVASYVEWEERMNGFLLEPFYSSRSNPDTAEHPFEPGELLDQRFRVVRQIAQGGMGVVYEAIDEKLERRVALKCAKAGFGKRLPPEVRNATAISHPNVCKIFEIHTASTSNGEIDFLTMEFLDGETLAERLFRGPIPQTEALTIALQLCAGLAEAHRNRVIHGDLKSNNVILTKGGDGSIRAVITDFGLARATESLHTTHPGVSGGTPEYMAPELWEGEKASVSSDIYALGVILYELACGRRPHALSVPEDGRETRNRKPVPAHPKWDRVVFRCLDPNPAKRFQDAGQIAEALAPRSRRWRLTAAIAAGVALISAFITYERATAPKESFSIAMTPISASAGLSAISQNISRDAESKIGLIEGGKRARVHFIPSTKGTSGATHIAHAEISQQADKVVVHAFLTDARNQANIADREFKYAPSEVRYAGMAMAGMVTNALRLPAMAVAEVNSGAKQDYIQGLGFTRRNSTIDQALPPLERAVSADPDSPLTWAALGEAQWFKYFITQDPAWLERTSESLRQAQNRNLDLAPVHRVTGLLRNNAGFYEQAEAEYLRAIELDPSNADAYRRLGMVYDSNNQIPQALTAFQKAVELEPGYFKVYQDLGAYYSHRGNENEAIRQFERCVQLAPDEPDAHYVLGSAYLESGRDADAERELRAALALGGTPRTLNNLALAMIYQGRYQEAIPLLVRALERFPTRYLWWMNLGDSYRRTDQPAESAVAYRRSMELVEKEMAQNPRDGVVRSRLSYLCARLGDRKRAETEVAQALQLSPESADARDAAVWTYEALAKREASLSVLSTSSDHALKQILRRVDLADLHKDSRFQQLLAARQIK